MKTWNGFHLRDAGLATLLLFAAVGCSSGEKTLSPRQQAKELQEELDVGRGIAASLLGKYKLDESKPWQTQYLSTIGTYLAKQVGRPELTYRFAIVKEGPVNAYACPGGFIFLTRALVDRLKSEDELIGVLSHEIGHVNLNHVYQKVKKPRDVSFGATLSRLMSQGGGDIGFAFTEAVQAGMKLLTEEGLGPKMEAEADEQAVIFAMAISVDPGALHRFLARTGDSQLGLPKSHPALSERLRKLETWQLTQTGTPPSLIKEPKKRVERFQKRMAQR